MKEALDKIIRSRPIVLEVLETRGFDTTPFQNELPTDLITKASAPLKDEIELDLLRIQVSTKTADEKAHVLYWMGVIRHKLNDKEKFDKLLPEEIGENDQIIVLLNEPLHKNFHETAIRQWAVKKQRVSFFDIRQLIFNPSKHSMVPLHRKVLPEEVDPLLERLLVKSKMELPHIKYHFDMQARILGLLPGEIVEIKRPSPTIGEYLMYRICTP
jgi:DNA-directed RNA polymerase subunit H (RpoH/RPB5)